MKKLFTLLCLFIAFNGFCQIRISQVYGGGGNGGATYNQDFVEIFNAGSASVNIGSWSVQYASAAGTNPWAVAAIPASTNLAAGKYFLVALASGATGIALPTPDVSLTSINLSGTAGKVAIVNNTTALLNGLACSNAAVVDVLGYGSTASCFETAILLTTGITNAQSMNRLNSGCTDNNNNNTDFALATVLPRNNATAANLCGAPAAFISASPNITNLNTSVGSASASQLYNLSANNLTPAAGNVTITPSAGLEISFNNSTFFANAQTLAYTTATIASTPIYVRLATTAAQGPITGTITNSGGSTATAAVVNVSGVVTQNFYTKTVGSLSDLATWGTVAANGSGTAPISFTSAYQIFTVQNREEAFPTAPWEVSGTGSKLVIGNGVDSTIVFTTDIDTIKATSLVDITDKSALIVGNKVAPLFGVLAITSSVAYTYDGIAINDTVKINNTSYGNLFLVDGLKYFKGGVTTVNQNLAFIDVANCNGANASPFTTVSLKGDLTMDGICNIEDSATGAAGRFTLSMAGNGTQNISTNNNDLSLFRLIRDTIIGTSNVDINLGATSKVTLGNNTSGGLNLLQKIGGVPSTTKLTLTGTTRLSFVKNGIVFNDVNSNKVGKIDAQNGGEIYINKSINNTSTAGTLKFETNANLNKLIINITTATKDSIILNDNLSVSEELNLIKGKIVMALNKILTMENPFIIVGGNNTSFVDGLLENFTTEGKAFFPVGRGTKYGPASVGNSALGGRYLVQYYNSGYNSYPVDPATLATFPNYNVSRKEYWSISEVNGNGIPAEVTLFYTDANSVIGNPTALRGAHYNGVSNYWEDRGTGQTESNTSNNGKVTLFNVTNFSPFTFSASVSGVLPVKINSFTAVKDGKAVKINFSTITEQNVKHFVIEKSTDGKKWQNLNIIAANGNTTILQTYADIDFNPTTGLNFYRIKTVDTDGSFAYSAIKTVLFTTNFELVLSPNPATDIVTIYLTKNRPTTACITIDNANGTKLYQEYSALQNIKINVANFAKGTYFVTVFDEGQSVTKKLIIK